MNARTVPIDIIITMLQQQKSCLCFINNKIRRCGMIAN